MQRRHRRRSAPSAAGQTLASPPPASFAHPARPAPRRPSRSAADGLVRKYASLAYAPQGRRAGPGPAAERLCAAMRGYNCGHHAGECPTATTSEGTFCTLYGVQVDGPSLVCSDFRWSCSRVVARAPAATAALRARQSLERSTKRALGPPQWKAAMARLYPDMAEPLRDGYADAFRRWSLRLAVTPTTHPSVRQWAILFSATVGDKLATGDNLCAAVGEFGRLQVDPRTFNPKFGFSCKKMNATWRSIRNKAMDAQTGSVLIPFEPPHPPRPDPQGWGWGWMAQFLGRGGAAAPCPAAHPADDTP